MLVQITLKLSVCNKILYLISLFNQIFCASFNNTYTIHNQYGTEGDNTTENDIYRDTFGHPPNRMNNNFNKINQQNGLERVSDFEVDMKLKPNAIKATENHQPVEQNYSFNQNISSRKRQAAMGISELSIDQDTNLPQNCDFWQTKNAKIRNIQDNQNSPNSTYSSSKKSYTIYHPKKMRSVNQLHRQKRVIILLIVSVRLKEKIRYLIYITFLHIEITIKHQKVD